MKSNRTYYIGCERKLGTGYVRSFYVGLWSLSSSGLRAGWDSGRSRTHGNSAANPYIHPNGWHLAEAFQANPMAREPHGQLRRCRFLGVNFGVICFRRSRRLVQPPYRSWQPSCGRGHPMPWQRNQRQRQSSNQGPRSCPCNSYLLLLRSLLKYNLRLRLDCTAIMHYFRCNTRTTHGFPISRCAMGLKIFPVPSDVFKSCNSIKKIHMLSIYCILKL